MTMKRIIRSSVPPEADLPDDLHPVLRRVLAARGVRSVDELDFSLNRLHPHHALSGIDAAVALLIDAMAHRQRIMVVADFDADGATSCAVAVRGLRLMGAEDVGYIVPNRFEYGYGLTPEIVAVAHQQKPDLLITVDNGIASVAGVRQAKALGMRVLITDHHLAGAELPPADAIVNPNLPGDCFPSKHLAGVGVMFYLLMALRARQREDGVYQKRPEPNLAELLDLVALGTVADVVTMDANNRVLVAQGLARIRAGRCCAGIRAICRVAGRALKGLSAKDLGFVIAPRLNAAGRLTDMSLGIACLLTDDEPSAQEMALRLHELNRERREIEDQMQQQAMAELDRLSMDDRSDIPLGLCMFDEDWHQGVIGILASRIKDRFHRPVVAFAPAGENQLKGSGRSVSSVHLKDVLDAVATRHVGLMDKFGGHAMAVGLTLAADRLERFRRAFDEEVGRHLCAEDIQGVVRSDGALSADDLSIGLAEHLRTAAPWGQGFPPPVFDGEFELLSRKIVGGKHLKLRLKPVDSDQPLDAIAFNTLDDDWPSTVGRVQIAYGLDVNEFRGSKRLQLLIEHMAPL